jgi:aspartyl-tRNA(Asn)/glutamyl-tRNA(Gln) amidotransferase subunit A
MANANELLNELLSFDVAALSQKLRGREVSPVEVTEAYLARIEEVDKKLNAYITVTADVAREAAKRAESEIAAGNWRGPFHGVPVALKDLCYTKGIATTGGSKILEEFVPDYDCTFWSRLAAQGAVLLGKLNLHEFAYGITSSNPHWGVVKNPYDTTRIPGGSSGGSAAAIVAQMAAATIGSDTAGSIRIPAAFCGCVGLKPTWSRVSRYGVIPLSDSLDHAGPITRTVRDAALMLGVIAGHDPKDATSSRELVPDYTQALDRDIRGMRIGVIKELRGGVSAEVEHAFASAIETLGKLGASVDEVSVPSMDTALAFRAIIGAEALEFHDNWLKTRAGDYGEDVRERLIAASMISASDYVRAQRARTVMLADAMQALEKHDVLLAPVSAIPAPRIGTHPGRPLDDKGEVVDINSMIIRFTMPFDATGQPALALPTGLSPDGLPLSMQIIGRPFGESSLIRVADAYEAARGPLPEPKL